MDQEEDQKPNPEKPVWKVQTWRFSTSGSDRTPLPIPDTDFVEDWSPDGQWFVTSSDRHPPYGRGYQLYVMRTDGSEPRRLTAEGLNVYARFSPDSKQIVYTYQTRGGTYLRTVNIDGTGQRQVMNEPSIGPQACWSPDGKRLAAVVHDWPLDSDGKQRLSFGEGDFRVEIMDADGQNRHRLALPKAEFISSLDWR